ncbi:MAG TPA: PatB family C-S lyase [Candidatus Dormibacteraeota bacterium]|nr:PatB family C-S lyase [Candidatus Dormibacteraeota bacterium]
MSERRLVTEDLLLPIEALRRRRGAKWRRYGPDVLPAWLADMDYAVAEPVRRAMARLVEDGDYGYPHRVGADNVQAAFAERMAQRFGWRPDPELVVPVADLVQALLAAVAAQSEPGDGVLVHTPIYPPFLEAIGRTGRRPVFHPLRDDGRRLDTDPEGLAAAVDAGTRMLLLCNPHNPSGRVLDRSELEAVARVAVERDLVVVADEVHCDMVYPGHVHVPLATLGDDVAERTITLNSATKSFNIPGLRCGVMHFGSAALLRRFRAAFPERMLGTVGAPGVDATVAAWREGQPWLDAVMALLAANRDRVAAWAAAHAPPVRHHPPEATYLAWLDCGGLPLAAAVTPQRFFLEEARVALNGGPEFGPGGDDGVRLTFATSPAILDELLERMSDAIRRSSGSVR